MYHVVIHQITRGFWGPKHREIVNVITESADEVWRVAGPYDQSNWHLVTIKNMNDFMGGNDGIVPFE